MGFLLVPRWQLKLAILAEVPEATATSPPARLPPRRRPAERFEAETTLNGQSSGSCSSGYKRLFVTFILTRAAGTTSGLLLTLSPERPRAAGSRHQHAPLPAICG